MTCYSDKPNWHNAAELAEEYRGAYAMEALYISELTIADSKFKVVYDSIERLQSGEVSELPAHAATYSFIQNMPCMLMFLRKDVSTSYSRRSPNYRV